MANSKTATKPAAKSKTAKKMKPAPDGGRTVTPHLVIADASGAIAFYKKAFKAEELMRIPGADGKIMHACIKIGDSPVFLVDENAKWGMLGPKALKGSPVTMHLQVEDADGFVKKAVAAGAKLTMPVDDTFWGDRYGQIEDPYGHRWSVATHVRDIDIKEIKAAAKKMGW